jgi:hypothetical protein
VVPSASSTWNYSGFDIGCGSIVAIIYHNKVLYAVVGDTGPTGIIGEASYASAKTLGIDPDPATGGTDSGVTYLVFQGANRASPIESTKDAVARGQQLTQDFLARN